MIGTVLRADDDEPITGAMVVVRDREGEALYSGVTNEEGKFQFMHPDQRTERFSLSVEHLGYGTINREIEFRPGEQLDVEVVLAEEAVELDPIVVTARRRGLLVDVGFYERLEGGAGFYVEREEIERRVPSRLTDLLVRVPGVRLLQTGGTSYDIRSVMRGRVETDSTGACQPSIWLDGGLVRPGGEPRPGELQLSDVISPEQVEGIEVYMNPAGMPPQYGGSTAACGAVVIWSRR